MSETQTLAAFAASIQPSALPAAVAERAKLLVMDTVGIALRARHDAESTPALLAAVAALGQTGGTARVIGDDATYAPAAAALINGTLAHSLDFDDTHAPGSLHPSAPIVPAALAAAEMCGADGATTLAAIVAGYEVQIRVSKALGPADHYARGFHPTATCGAFGAAAAAGRVFGLDAAAMAHALGIALSQTAGSLQFLHDGAWTKRFQGGWAANSGLVAATLARAGFKGPGEALEGRLGFLKAYAPSPDPARAVAGLGSTWETLGTAVKPYPSCRFTHAAMDALIAMRAEDGVDWRNVIRIEVGVPQAGMALVGAPAALKQKPKNAVDGQFSMAFCSAVALRQGGMGWDDYARHLGDADTLALTRKVDTGPHPQAQAVYPDNLGGHVVVHAGGKTYERFVGVPKGEPDNFLTAAELRAKFDGLVEPYLSPARRSALAAALGSFERAQVPALLELTRPDRAEPMRMAGED